MVDEQAVPELVVERLRQGSKVAYTVRTASMSPLLLPGDRVVVSPAGRSFRTGDLVFRLIVPRPVVHRVVALLAHGPAPSVVTKGDAAQHSDGQQPIDAFVGIVTEVVRSDRTLNLMGVPAQTFGRWIAVMSVRQDRSFNHTGQCHAYRWLLRKLIYWSDRCLWWFAR
jgi:hypothetical protein